MTRPVDPAETSSSGTRVPTSMSRTFSSPDEDLLDELRDVLDVESSAGTSFEITLRGGVSVIALDMGDGLRLMKPCTTADLDGARLLAVQHASEAFSRALATFDDSSTQQLAGLVRDAAALHVTEQLKEAIRPDWAVDPPPRAVEQLARSAATARRHLSEGPLVALPARDVASYMCLFVRDFLLGPLIFGSAQEFTCDGCGAVVLAARWTYTTLRDESEASSCFCTDCANLRAYDLARLLFWSMPYDNSAVIELFNGLTPSAIKVRFRRELSNVASAIRDGLISESLLERPGIVFAQLPRDHEDAEHYAHVPLERALTSLGVDQRRAAKFLRAWKDRAKAMQADRAKRASGKPR